MKNRGVVPQLPDCSEMHLIEFLFEVGPSHDGNPITHAEIESWKVNTGTELTFWEARTLHQLSKDYVRQSHQSIERDCPAPYSLTIEDQRELVANKFRAFMSNSRVTRE